MPGECEDYLHDFAIAKLSLLRPAQAVLSSVRQDRSSIPPKILLMNWSL